MTHDSTPQAGDDGTQWWRAELLGHDPDLASSRLWALGAQGVEVRDGETFFENDPSFAPLPDGAIRLIAFFQTDQAAAVITGAKLQDQSLWDVVSWAHFEDDSWKTKWKEFFRPRHLSPRFMVGPPWEDFVPPSQGWKIVVEPGMAFGTGTHETTQLVAHVIDELIARDGAPEAMLDVGSGSGILSIQAALLGVGQVMGLDIDLESMENARHNVGLNGLDGHDIAFATTPLAQLPGTYPLVVANILAHILISLAPHLISHTAPGGTLILSGLLKDQLSDITQAFGACELLSQASNGPWLALVMRR